MNNQAQNPTPFRYPEAAAQTINPFGFHCAGCGQTCRPLHLTIQVHSTNYSATRHFCTISCAVSWLNLGFKLDDRSNRWCHQALLDLGT